MATEVRLPNLGESIAHARLAVWLKKTGERVSRGDVIAEVETDKTSVEIEAPDSGVLAAIHVPAGTEHVVVGQLLAVLEAGDVAAVGSGTQPGAPASLTTAVIAEPADPSRETPRTPAAVSDSAETQSQRFERVSIPAHQPQAAKPAVAVIDHAHSPGAVSHANGDAHVAATPLARRMMNVAGLPFDSLQGSGAAGIITKMDVDRALAPDPPVSVRATAEAVRAAVRTPQQGDANDVRSLDGTPDDSLTAVQAHAFDVVRLSPMRRVAAERLTQSKQQIPHFYLHVDCDMEAVCKVRDDLNARADARLSLTAFSLRAAALALRRVPSANATWVDGVLRVHKTVDLAFAVNTPLGLVAPVVRDADQKSIVALNAELRALAERARDGKLSPDEYTGGTCTISNLGMYGVKGLYPIINPPQTCILGVGAVEERPAVREHQVTIARMMTCTLSADHRALDGATGAEFLSAFRALLEDPWALLM